MDGSEAGSFGHHVLGDAPSVRERQRRVTLLQKLEEKFSNDAFGPDDCCTSNLWNEDTAKRAKQALVHPCGTRDAVKWFSNNGLKAPEYGRDAQAYGIAICYQILADCIVHRRSP